MNLISDNVADLQLTFNKDIYQLATQQSPFNNEQKQKIIGKMFNELMNNINKLEPGINMLFTGYAGKCFNNKIQFTRKIVLKCLWLSVNPKYRATLSKDGIDKLDNPNYITIYKQIFNILQEFGSYYTCLWFFFQVPNYINFNVVGYRQVYEAMLDYAIDNWKEKGYWTLGEYITTTKGSTFYYNLVYHGLSNKVLISKWNSLLMKIVPELVYTSKRMLKYKSGNKGDKSNNSISNNKTKIRICFISDKLQHYTSVLRDRIGVITGLNSELFDVSIAIYGSKLINNESIKLPTTFHPVIMGMIKKFIDKDKVILLNKLDIGYNRNKLIGKFHIIFYPDLGMKQNQSLLALSRLAPIQITTWGHSDTSGSPNIDYYITSKYYERCDDLSLIKNNYIEKPIVLTSLGTYYFNPLAIAHQYFSYNSDLLSINGNMENNNIQGDNNIHDNNIQKYNGIRQEYNYEIDMNKISNKKIIIGCLQSNYKINAEFEECIKEILDNLTPYYDVEIYLSNSIPFNKIHLNRLNNTLKSHKNRIKWFSNLNQKQWLEVMSKCYLMIDPFPFGGCNTSLEAFSLNIPVVALPSNNISGRFTYGFYNKMGVDLDNVIATNSNDYVNKVVNLVKEKGIYYKLVKNIYINKYKLFEEIESVNEYEKVFKMLVNKLNM